MYILPNYTILIILNPILMDNARLIVIKLGLGKKFKKMKYTIL